MILEVFRIYVAKTTACYLHLYISQYILTNITNTIKDYLRDLIICEELAFYHRYANHKYYQNVKQHFTTVVYSSSLKHHQLIEFIL